MEINIEIDKQLIYIEHSNKIEILGFYSRNEMKLKMKIFKYEIKYLFSTKSTA